MTMAHRESMSFGGPGFSGLCLDNEESESLDSQETATLIAHLQRDINTWYGGEPVTPEIQASIYGYIRQWLGDRGEGDLAEWLIKRIQLN